MSTCPFKLRAELQPPPPRMRHLPIDARGYPVPFFVPWIDGEPEFRTADTARMLQCIREKLCWQCGQPLGAEAVFVIGPMCSVNRVSSEPPSHIECARYAAKNCPFLTRPHMDRRTLDLPEGKLDPAGIMIPHNPGVTLLYFARKFHVERFPNGRLWRFDAGPAGVEWYARGRAATRAEVLAAIDKGLPKLYEAGQVDGSAHMIEQWLSRAMKLVPKA